VDNLFQLMRNIGPRTAGSAAAKNNPSSAFYYFFPPKILDVSNVNSNYDIRWSVISSTFSFVYLSNVAFQEEKEMFNLQKDDLPKMSQWPLLKKFYHDIMIFL
jgi:hypothetical protein